MTDGPVGEEDAAAPPAWHAACAVSELIEGAALASVRGRRLMMITVDRQMYAFDDFCPHSGGPRPAQSANVESSRCA